MSAGQGRSYAAEQRKERESLEESIHSIQLESELTARALKQSVTVRCPLCLFSLLLLEFGLIHCLFVQSGQLLLWCNLSSIVCTVELTMVIRVSP